jgi:hypothetical protein
MFNLKTEASHPGVTPPQETSFQLNGGLLRHTLCHTQQEGRLGRLGITSEVTISLVNGHYQPFPVLRGKQASKDKFRHAPLFFPFFSFKIQRSKIGVRRLSRSEGFQDVSTGKQRFLTLASPMTLS